MSKKLTHVTEFESTPDQLAKAQDSQLFSLLEIVPHPLNPRGANLDLEGMIASYIRSGFYDANYPVLLAFDEKPTIKANVITSKSKARQIRGHRRVGAALQIIDRAEKTPTEIPPGQPDNGKETWKQIADRLFPNGMIPAVFVYGLSETDELKRLHDHDNKEKPLTFYEAISSALTLIDKYTEAKAAAILGLSSRDRIQNAKRFRALPKYAQEALRTGKVKPSALMKLHKAGNEDAGGARGEFVAADNFKSAFEAEKKKVESGGAEKQHFTAEQAKNHIIALCNECPPLVDIFAALRRGKEHATKAIEAAQALAKKLGIDPTKEPEDTDTDE